MPKPVWLVELTAPALASLPVLGGAEELGLTSACALDVPLWSRFGWSEARSWMEDGERVLKDACGGEAAALGSSAVMSSEGERESGERGESAGVPSEGGMPFGDFEWGGSADGECVASLA